MINFIEFESREFYEVKRKDQISRRKKASKDTKQNCLYHYLLCKKKEFKLTEKEDLRSILDEMLQSEKRYSACEALQEGELNYISKWNSILGQYMMEAQ